MNEGYKNRIDAIVRTVSDVLDVPTADACGNSRHAHIAQARHIAIHLVVRTTDIPVPVIARFFHRTRFAMYYSLRKVKDLCHINDELMLRDLEACKEALERKARR